jgi:hypothetical protein
MNLEVPPDYSINRQPGQLQEMLSEMTYDPQLLGIMTPVPIDLHMTLKELGITDLQELLCRGRQRQQRMINTSELCKRIGRMVRWQHKLTLKVALKVALNRLTLLRNGNAEHPDYMSYDRSTDLSTEECLIDPMHAITQINPTLNRDDMQTIQDCYAAFNQQNHLVSPVVKNALDIKKSRKRKRKPLLK